MPAVRVAWLREPYPHQIWTCRGWESIQENGGSTIRFGARGQGWHSHKLHRRILHMLVFEGKEEKSPVWDQRSSQTRAIAVQRRSFERRLILLREPILAIKRARTEEAEGAAVEIVGTRARLDQDLSPGRSPDSGEKSEERSSVRSISSFDTMLCVLPMAVMAGKLEPG